MLVKLKPLTMGVNTNYFLQMLTGSLINSNGKRCLCALCTPAVKQPISFHIKKNHQK